MYHNNKNKNDELSEPLKYLICFKKGDFVRKKKRLLTVGESHGIS